MNHRTIVILLIILSAGNLYPQSAPFLTAPFLTAPDLTEEEEAPDSIFGFSIGDTDVAFYLSGTWTFSILASTGLLFTSYGGVQLLDTFPSFAGGFFFKQTPDMTLSTRIDDRYFLDVTYRGNDKENIFLAGYEGKENELINHIYIGNSAITLSPSPYLNIPDAGNSSIGAKALLDFGQADLGQTSSEILLRYDYTNAGKKSFKGLNEVVEYRFSPESYDRGSYFKLPDDTIENPIVYLEDPAGSIIDPAGRKYRKAGAEDIILDTKAGTLSIKKKPTGRVLIYYSKGGIPVGDALNGTGALVGENLSDADTIDPDEPAKDFNFSLASHLGEIMTDKDLLLSDNHLCLLLYTPGLFSSFEISGAYHVEGGFPEGEWMSEVSIVRKGTTSKTSIVSQVQFKNEKSEERLKVFIDDDLRSNFRNLYPFIDESPAIYGPLCPVQHVSPDYEILLELLFPVSVFQLELDIIPGSIRVMRNNMEENRFTADYATGVITFDTEILPTDRLDIYYKTRFASFDKGDILFGFKNRIDFNDFTFLELSTGIKWNVVPGSFTEKAYERTGSVLGLCSFQTDTKNFDLAITLAGSVTNPDTTGIFRLLGMEEAGIEVPVSEETAWPCPAPVDYGAAVFPISERGCLLYKNYREYGILGDANLQPVTWDVPASQVFPCETGSKSGPYEVAGSSVSSNDKSIVMDFVIPSDREWAGIRLPLIKDKETVDLSGSTSLSFSFKALDLTQPVSLYIQIGEIGEDIDNDSMIDEETSSISRGFDFNDTSNSVTLKIGGGPKAEGNGRRDSEDIDENKCLDPSFAERIVVIGPVENSSLSVAAGDTPWQLVNIFFNEDQKRQLARCRAVSVIIGNEGAGDAAGKILIDRIFFSGEIQWNKEWTSTGTPVDEGLFVRETEEQASVNLPSKPLAAAHDEVQTIFHPAGETQKVLEAAWNSVEPGERWKLTCPGIRQVEGIMYEEVSCYIRMPVSSATSERLTLSLLDENNRGISIGFDPLILASWKKLKVDLKTKKAYLDNEELPADISIDKRYASFAVFSIGYENTSPGSSAGILYLDEVHLKSPQLDAGGALSLAATVDLPGALVSIGGTPILSDFYLKQSASLMTSGFAPLDQQAAGALLFQSITDMSIAFPFTDLAMSLAVTGEDIDYACAGGHSVSFPREGESFFRFNDTYSLIADDSHNDFYRSDSLVFKDGEERPVVDLAASAYTLESKLVQNWGISGAYYYKELFSLSAKALYMVSSDSYAYIDDWYIPLWINGFRYLLPVEDNILDERSGGFSLDTSLAAIPVGAGLQSGMSMKSSNIADAGRDYTGTCTLSAGLPLTLKAGDTLKFIITPSYARSLSSAQILSGRGDISEDILQWGNTINEYSCFFTLIPFAEFFSADAEDMFIVSGETPPVGAAETVSTIYKPVFSLSFAKESAGTSLVDFLIPSSLDISISKQFEKSRSLYDFFSEYTLTMKNKAINIFGKFGNSPVFDFYTIDEYQFDESIKIINRDNEFTYQLLFYQYASFAQGTQIKLLLENHLNFYQDDSFDIIDFGSLTLEWTVIPENPLPIPFITEKERKASFFTHKESISYSVKNYFDPDQLSYLTIIPGHTTILQFPPHGYILAGVSLGMDMESLTPGYGDIEAVRIGIQGSIEAHIQY